MAKSEHIILAGIALLLIGYIFNLVGYTVPFWLLGLLFLGVIGASHDS